MTKTTGWLRAFLSSGGVHATHVTHVTHVTLMTLVTLGIGAMGLSSGTVHADDSNLRVWGSPSFSGSIQSDDVVVEVAAGYFHTVALLGDGSMRCWGDNDFGQCDVPSGVGEPGNLVTAVAAGGNMTVVALDATDCNDNGIIDSTEIAQGLAEDCNGNGIPDSCDLARGDLNLDGCIGGADLSFLLSLWGLPNPPIGDLNGDGVVSGADLATLLAEWDGCG